MPAVARAARISCATLARWERTTAGTAAGPSPAGRLAQRLEPVHEHLPDGVAQLGRQVARVEPRLGRQLGGQLLADDLGQALGLGGLTGHQRVGLDVEDEVGRSAFDAIAPRRARTAARSRWRRSRPAGTGWRSTAAAPRPSRRRAGRRRCPRSWSDRSRTRCRRGPSRRRRAARSARRPRSEPSRRVLRRFRALDRARSP